MNFPYTTLPGIPKDTKRPLVPIKFIHKNKSTLPILCLVDSGADYSYLATEIASFLGSDQLSNAFPCILGQENFFSKARVIFERYKWNLDIRLVQR